jgi:phytoene synthase
MPGELRLQWWREAVAGTGNHETAGHPVAAALRDVVVRFRIQPQALIDLIDARVFDLYNEPMPSLAEVEVYAVRTSSRVFELAARILCDGRGPSADLLARHAGIAYAISGLLRALPVHATRRQLYLPADVMRRHGAQPEDVFAGRATTELRAALADMRLRARQHLVDAQNLVDDAPAAIRPAFLPAALVRPALERMERRNYQPFRPGEIPQWQRQWTLWRAARTGLRDAF